MSVRVAQIQKSSTRSSFTSIAIILIIYGAALVGGWVSFSYFASNFERQTLEAYSERQLAHTRSMATILSMALTSLEQGLTATSVLLDGDETDIEQLRAFYETSPLKLGWIAHLDIAGRVIASWPPTALPEDLRVTEHLSVVSSGLALSVPVYQGDSRSGTLSSSVGVEALIGQLALLEGNTTLWLIDEQFDVLPLRNPLQRKLSAAELAELQQLLKSSESAVTSSEVVSILPVVVGSKKFTFLTRTPRQSVLKPYLDNLSVLRSIALIFFTVMVGSSLLVLYLEQAKLKLAQDLQNKLQQSEKKYRTLIEDSNDAILLISPDELVKLANKRATEFFGRSEEELLGTSLAKLLGEDATANLRSCLTGAASAKGSVIELSFMSSGESVTTIVSVSAVYNRRNEHIANMLVFTDITQKKRAEHQLEQMQEALRQAQKMESISTLAAGIAHDFNNILGVVLGYISLIKNRLQSQDPNRHYLEIIETSSRRAAELTQRLLAFARGGKYSVSTIEINSVVKKALQLVASTLGKKIDVQLSFYPEKLWVEGDAEQIVQALVNILINAGEAMPDGGCLTIATELVSGGDLNLPVCQQEFVCVSVADTGIGISQEALPRLFEPFYTTKREHKHSGLGLAMVYGIVKNHGGQVRVESELGKGSKFYIYLPRGVQPEGPSEVVDVVVPAPGRSEQETILVVDDEEMLRELIVEALSDAGYNVVAAENGKEAVDIYRKTRVDLVILDMIMPEMNGAEAFREIRSINPSAKVLLSSGYSQEAEAQSILSEGALGFLQKPYAIGDLLAKIRSVLN
ncbi:MAG: response regulator [Acidobacteriota bacterium]|nr:response regulator [Blastocatellia bacterium]MDW8413309.1 response regulator [Acidobacteriota bacterium]